jgi:hypothetical protein
LDRALIPGFGVSTPDAYAWYDRDREMGHAAGREPQYVPGPWPSRAAQMINDLEGAIARHHPEIDQMKAALRRSGAIAPPCPAAARPYTGFFSGVTMRRRPSRSCQVRAGGSC